MAIKTIKPKKCKVCGELFTPRSSLQKCCSMSCALTFARKNKEKEELRENNKRKREYKERNKTHHELIKEAQSAVNQYVRVRDIGKGCISCGAPLSADGVGGGFDAGHYRSRGSAPHLRFYTLQIHGQCKRCNRYLGGNYSQYRVGLIDRLGQGIVDKIEADNTPRHYSNDDLRRLRAVFLKKIKLLIKRRG